MTNLPKRCGWCGNDPLYIAYHDEEWGVPLHDDQRLFEFLILEGAQAGLSWLTILKKRNNYRQAYDNFDPETVARYTARKKNQLLNNAGIVRNKLKIEASIHNARCFLDIQEQFGSFDEYIWQFTDGKTIQNNWRSLKKIPVTTTHSDNMSRDLKQRGFKFTGSTICYAFMQAIGMVNDHLTGCFRHRQLAEPKRK